MRVSGQTGQFPGSLRILFRLFTGVLPNASFFQRVSHLTRHVVLIMLGKHLVSDEDTAITEATVGYDALTNPPDWVVDLHEAVDYRYRSTKTRKHPLRMRNGNIELMLTENMSNLGEQGEIVNFEADRLSSATGEIERWETPIERRASSSSLTRSRSACACRRAGRGCLRGH